MTPGSEESGLHRLFDGQRAWAGASRRFFECEEKRFTVLGISKTTVSEIALFAAPGKNSAGRV